jgi:hypothetical protein
MFDSTTRSRRATPLSPLVFDLLRRVERRIGEQRAVELEVDDHGFDRRVVLAVAGLGDVAGADFDVGAVDATGEGGSEEEAKGFGGTHQGGSFGSFDEPSVTWARLLEKLLVWWCR